MGGLAGDQSIPQSGGHPFHPHPESAAVYDPAKPPLTLFPTGGPEDRTLYYGDCLDWMSQWENECVDLIYLDPPFNSNAKYNVLYTDQGAGKAQYRAFDDTWSWNDKAEARLAIYEGAVGRPARNAVLGLERMLGPSGMLAYLTYMAERLEQCRRLLKPTGSIYLHCDPTASHYLKVVLDGIFGPANFRNEIIWKRTSGHSDARRFGRAHDVILYYTAGDSPTWNQSYQAYDPDYVERYYRYKDDDDRRWMSGDLSASGLQGGGYEYEWKGVTRTWRVPPNTMERLVAENRIYYTRNGIARIKRYLDEMSGLPAQDLWTDIQALRSWHKERLGYPTQKPRALLKRIIEASTNEGDLVLDPFCGCGTAVDAANRLGRRWAGVDISSFAIDLIRERRMADPDIAVQGMPYDLRSAAKLAKEKPFDFESWAIMRMPGFVPNTVQVGDGGIDGRARLATKPANHKSRLALAQVKGGSFSLSKLRDFIHVTNREKAALGVYVTLDPVTSAAARAETARTRTVTVGAEQYRRCQIWPIADYFDNRRPHLPTMTDPYTGKPIVQADMFA